MALSCSAGKLASLDICNGLGGATGAHTWQATPTTTRRDNGWRLSRGKKARLSQQYKKPSDSLTPYPLKWVHSVLTEPTYLIDPICKVGDFTASHR